MERIDLSAHGFYITPNVGFAEVEIDTLTGDFYTRRADIVMDLGYSLNPVELQIEGAFVQGLGWVALEELKWGDAHHKIFAFPVFINCESFADNVAGCSESKGAIHSSEAAGEPPFFLASSVFFAIKDAIIAARAEEGLTDRFPLDNPATPERIRMACVDSFTKRFASPNCRPKLSV